MIPLAEVGTDGHRLEMWRQPAADAYNAKAEGHAWKFSHFRQSDGYVSVPLDGVWLRGPYLAQRIGAVAGRSARAGRSPAEGVLARLRRHRPDEGRVRHRWTGRAARRHEATTRPCRRPATPVTFGARPLIRRGSARCWNI